MKNCLSCNHICHCNVDKCSRCACSKCIHPEETLILKKKHIPWWKKILNYFK